MVVCKCRKATKLYCFVHKVPVCGECICFPEHQICVVRTYSEWVIDGDYDWPPKCCFCHAVLEETSDFQTTRLGCLHVIHKNCFVSRINSLPPHTAPAGYTCPTCATSIWPPKSVKDTGSRLHSELKEAIIQTGLEKNVFGKHPVTLPSSESRSPPTAFASDPLVHVSANGVREPSGLDILEIDGPNAVNPSVSNHDASYLKSLNATARKSAAQVERQNSEISYYADDEDGNAKKYTRRGTLRHKFLRSLLPFWSPQLPTLPVTAPPRKDAANSDDAPDDRVRLNHRSPRMDPRKILLLIAIMACMATMGILYYRLAQGGLGEELPEDEQ